MSKVVTIHQPDFMPWLGLYNKISKVDEWVVLDHVTNNPRDAAFWGRRVQMIAGGKPTWISVPLIREPGKLSVPINEMKVNWQEGRAISKSIQSIVSNYRKAPFFAVVFPIVEEYFTPTTQTLAEKNMQFMTTTLEKLGIKPTIVWSSSLDCELKSTELLVEILQKRQATRYLCGAGAVGYQEDALFAQVNIDLEYNSFTSPAYPQFNTLQFCKGLSIIDAFMNIGFDGVEKLIKVGV